MIRWRVFWRAPSSPTRSGSPKNIAPTTLSDSCWLSWAGSMAVSTVADAPGARSSRRATLPPRTMAGSWMVSSEALVIVPLSRPSSSRRSVRIERHVDGALGLDRPQRPEADAQVADPRRVALEHVEAGPAGLRAAEVAADRGRQQRTAGHADLVGATGRREDPVVRLGDALGGARGAAHDGDLVDDDVAAAEERSEAVRTHGERDDQRRHRDPRPLALVEVAQDQVVDRADQEDVAAEQRDEALDRRQREGGQLRGRLDDLAVVAAQRRARRAASG